MPPSKSVSDFQWVNSTDAAVPKDHETRTRIRKQAMKRGAITRKNGGNLTRINVRQLPVFEIQASPLGHGANLQAPALSEECSDGAIPCKATPAVLAPSNALTTLSISSTISASMSRTGYELMVARYGLDTIDLSVFTSLEVGRSTGKLLVQDESQLASLLSYKQDSFFAYLPARFGYLDCLNDATECAMARVCQILSPHSRRWETIVVSLYTRALKSLQKALNCPSQRLAPEVLCATEILAIYELLNPSREHAWIQHSTGAARLIRLRGPDRWESEYEKCLFMAHAGPLVTEAVFDNQRCFLEEDSWTHVIQSMIANEEIFPERSEIVISMLLIIRRIPGLLMEITTAICHSCDLKPARVYGLRDQARQLCSDLNDWRCQHPEIFSPADGFHPGKPPYDKLVILLALVSTGTILCNRMLIAVFPLDGRGIERETQEYATKILLLQNEAATEGVAPYVGVFLERKVKLAQATANTEDEWLESIKSAGRLPGRHNQMVEKGIFERWCSLFGRKTSRST